MIRCGIWSYCKSLLTLLIFFIKKHICEKLIDEGKVKLVLVIPPDFSDDLISGRQASVQFLVDGMDANAATTIIGYAQAVTLQYSQKIVFANLSMIGRKSYIPIQTM